MKPLDHLLLLELELELLLLLVLLHEQVLRRRGGSGHRRHRLNVRPVVRLRHLLLLLLDAFSLLHHQREPLLVLSRCGLALQRRHSCCCRCCRR